MRESQRSRGARRGRELIVELGRTIRAGRLAAGLTQEHLGTAVGVSAAEISRIERGRAPWLSVTTASELCSVLGLDLWVRSYPAGDSIRDASHAALLEHLRTEMAAPLRVRLEVPLPLPRDPRAWDLVAADARKAAAFEAETRITDGQALIRRLALKRRDGGMDRLILVVADRRANRAAIRAIRELLRADFPLDGGEILAALRSGRLPDAGGVLFL